MSGNRFEFLELGEDDSAPKRLVTGDLSGQEPAAGREPIAEPGPGGEPLAQVRDVDTRGYRQFLYQAQEQPETQALRNRLRTAPGALRPVEVFGERGTAAGQFNFPMGMAVDGDGILFVADSYNHRVQRITPDGGVSPLGGRGNGRGQFLSPQSVATDSANSFYIVEQGNNRVQKYSADGALQFIFGRHGTREGEFRGPTDVAVAPGSGDIYVADAGNGRVQRFDPLGNFLGAIGTVAGPGAPSFSPQALAVDIEDNLYVADPFSGRVICYDPLGRLARQLTPLFMQPRALACGLDGLLYVADAGDGAALDTNPHGRVLALHGPQSQVLAMVERLGRNLGSLSRPGGLAVTKRAADTVPGDLYVADTLNHRILRFILE